MRSLLLWDILQCRLVVSYWRFETTYQFHLQGWSETLEGGTDTSPLKMELIGCPETNNLFCVTSQTSEDLQNFFEFMDLKCSQTAVSWALCIKYNTLLYSYCLLLYPVIGHTQLLCLTEYVFCLGWPNQHGSGRKCSTHGWEEKQMHVKFWV
jgi:hypothetical protein